jgi:DNA-binding NtrC family response regulator
MMASAEDGLSKRVDTPAGGGNEPSCEVEKIICESPQMIQVLETARSVAGTDAPVLIRGEMGTGKELVARAIHTNGARRFRPFVPVRCGAKEPELEEQLFGHPRKPAGQSPRSWRGRLELGNGGTLFLEEVGVMGSSVQAAILGVIESRIFSRPGTGESLMVDIRVICSTSGSLKRQVEEGTFSRELHSRLGVAVITIPSLRDRREDIPPLAQHFLETYARRMNRPFAYFDPGAMDALVRHRWSGNVRELANAVERAVVVGRPPAVRLGDLPLTPDETGESTGSSLAEVEREHIQKVLEKTRWNITRGARILGIDRVTLYNKIKKYGLRKEKSLERSGPAA